MIGAWRTALPPALLLLRPGDREELERWTRASTVEASAAIRARIVLLAADGVANTGIAELADSTVTTVLAWRERYMIHGLAGLADRTRSGRPQQLDHADIVAATLVPPPKKYGVTHWSSRLQGQHLKISNTTVARAWRSYGIRPWKAESFRFYTDPDLVGKVTHIRGLYLGTNADIPANAIVLSVDEKSQIQALDWTVPILPIQPGKVERRSHDYYRHDTTTLFAALEIATGQVTAPLKPKHRHQEFVAFPRQIDRAYADRVDEHGDPVELHLVMDNYAAHKHAKVKAWLADHPRFKVHFTPTQASWMNLVECWFSLIERQGVRRGVFKSVKDLNTKLRSYIEGWNKRAHPFVWTKTADQILKKTNRPTTSNPHH